MGASADSGKYGYCMSFDAINKRYNAKVPLMPKGSVQRSFKNIQTARYWQIRLAHKEWGLSRWELLKSGRLSILRKFECGVSVRTTFSQTTLSSGQKSSYKQYGVFWYDHNGKPKAKLFSYRKFGQSAEIEAHWFAAQQRAILTNSELNLPDILKPSSFDLENATAINKSVSATKMAITE